jgi:hypothetical protein
LDVFRCDSDNKSSGPLEAEVISVLRSEAEANTSDESDGVAKKEDEQMGIFQVLDKLEEAVDALLDTSSGLSHPQLEVRTKQKPYGCPLCTKSFSSKKYLERHMRVHTGKKTFSCSQCIKSFAYKKGLTRHLIVHAGEKPYECSLCTKSFSRKRDVKRHMKVHTGEKPYSCVNCMTSFSRSDKLRCHTNSGVCRGTCKE